MRYGGREEGSFPLACWVEFDAAGMEFSRKRLYIFSVLIALITVLFLQHELNISSSGDLTETRNSPAAENDRVDHHRASNRANGSGYVLAMTYFDQLTGSKRNLLSMQCWAGTLGPQIAVVEPFVMHATFGVNLSAVSKSDTRLKGGSGGTKLGDIYNKQKWGERVGNLAPLVSWKIFIDDAPRKLIIVNKDCIETVHPLLCEDCTSLVDSLQFKQSVVAFAKRYDFEIVRNICIPASRFTGSKFNELIYGSYDPTDVVVIFEYWGGIEVKNGQFSLRMAITDLKQCLQLGFNTAHTPLNPGITEDAQKYLQKYLPSAVTRGYITVMVRTQYVAFKYKYFSGWSMGKVLDFLKTKCYAAVLREVNQMKKKHNIDSVLLTMDCSMTGSYYFRSHTELSETIANSSAILFQSLYGDSTSLLKWDRSFEDISTLKNPGYIALLQKHLAANSTCLLTVGSGTFQETTRYMYKEYHSGRPMCMKNIPC